MARETMEGIDKLPADIARAYSAVVRVFNSGEWNAAGVLVGRALEALVSDRIPHDKLRGTLNQSLELLHEHMDFTETIKTLTHGLRKGRNLGAHFHLEKEVSPEMASPMLEFLENILEYVYILPGRVKDLHDRL